MTTMTMTTMVSDLACLLIGECLPDGEPAGAAGWIETAGGGEENDQPQPHQRGSGGHEETHAALDEDLSPLRGERPRQLGTPHDCQPPPQNAPHPAPHHQPPAT